jgi:hypothetical protein
MDAYTEAHLFIAAIRVLQHQKGKPPALEDVCAMIGISVESGHALCRDLEKRGALETLQDPFSIKLNIADHLELEKIPRRQPEGSGLARELEKFRAEKKNKERKTAEIQAELDKKKRNMLADIEEKFKKEMAKYKKE